MCRLYGFRSNEPTKVECSLVHAQNALMVQSRADLQGFSNAHGWGIAVYEDTVPHVERQAWAAYHGEHFRRAAARIFARDVLAHVRRATVGPPAIENTHPFVHGRWAMAHNGTVPGFKTLRAEMLAAMTPEHRAAIRGVTDSEHVFRVIMSYHDRAPDQPLLDTVRLAVLQVIAWCRAINPWARIGLNLLLTDGQRLVGTRWGRTLHYIHRRGIYDCEICGFPHIHHEPGTDYRAITIASEPITHEAWREVPDHSIFAADAETGLTIEPLETATAPGRVRAAELSQRL